MVDQVMETGARWGGGRGRGRSRSRGLKLRVGQDCYNGVDHQIVFIVIHT